MSEDSKQIESLTAKVDSLTSEISQRDQTIQSLRSEVQDLKTEIKAEKEKIQSLVIGYEREEKRAEALQQRIDELEHQASEQTALLNEKEKEYQSFLASRQADIESLNKEVLFLQGRIAEKNDNIGALAGQLKVAEERCRDLEAGQGA